MNIIKNHMQNRVGDNKLNDCLVIYIENYIFIDIENDKSFKISIIQKIVKGNFMYGVPTIQKS